MYAKKTKTPGARHSGKHALFRGCPPGVFIPRAARFPEARLHGVQFFLILKIALKIPDRHFGLFHTTTCISAPRFPPHLGAGAGAPELPCITIYKTGEKCYPRGGSFRESTR